jgi:hypothetical protein
VLENACFTWITGENEPNDDYEIEAAMNKQGNEAGQRHIDAMKPGDVHGYFDNDGFEINSELMEKPLMCFTCRHDDDPSEELMCNLTRLDRQGAKEFACFVYKKTDFS